jgi:hypothetical protein
MPCKNFQIVVCTPRLPLRFQKVHIYLVTDTKNGRKNHLKNPKRNEMALKKDHL